LTKAAEQEDGELARFYQVKFEEDRGNLEQAIVIMRGIIETPAGRKTVHLRRLVDLLARSGDYDKALAAVEDWKRMAPGDHSAWKHRAKLLQANGVLLLCSLCQNIRRFDRGGRIHASPADL